MKSSAMISSDRHEEVCNGSGDMVITIDPYSRASTVVGINSEYDEKLDTNEHREFQVIGNDKIQEGDGNITVPLHDYPRGYPHQAAFQSSEPCFSIYRAFSYLHSRVILELQDEIRCLEDDLADIDETDNNSRRKKRLMSRDYDLSQSKREKRPNQRAQLLDKIRNKLVNYDEILAKAKDLNNFQRPSKRDYKSLRNWFRNKKPLCNKREENFIRRKEDLITLRQGREWSSFDGVVEDMVRWIPCRRLTRWLFTTPELRDKTDDKYLNYYSPARIEKLVGIIITLIIFILLVLPVVALYEMTSFGDRNSTFDAVGVLVVFTLLFSATMSLLTNARRHELFAASAAYCAVLVVFISNFGNDNTA